MQVQISKFFIFDAIRYAFSAEIRHLDSHLGEHEMPRLEIPPPEETHSVTLGPINPGEGTIAGNDEVLKNIFLQQLSFNHETDFRKRLFLV
jgi:hypothetical protein